MEAAERTEENKYEKTELSRQDMFRQLNERIRAVKAEAPITHTFLQSLIPTKIANIILLLSKNLRRKRVYLTGATNNHLTMLKILHNSFNLLYPH